MTKNVFLFVSLFLLVYGSEHYCLKFSVDTKSEYKFITIQIGTPLVAYRLLLCPSPKISKMNFYQTILLGSVFGSSVSNTFSSRFKDKNSGMKLDPKSFKSPSNEQYYDSPSSKIYSKMYSHRDETFNNVETFSKSVTFEELYVDQWSTIGEDFSRSLDGTWFKIGLEISNLKSIQRTFDSYCNPGGLGDNVAPESYLYDSSKYGQIDGFFLVGNSQTSLPAVYDFHGLGSTTVMVDNSILKYCYQRDIVPIDLAKELPHNSMISSKVSKHESYEQNNRINLNTKLQEQVRYMESVLVSMTNNDNFTSFKSTKSHLQDVKVSNMNINLGDNHRLPKFLIDTHVLDIPHVSNNKNTYKLLLKKKDFSDLNFAVLPTFLKQSPDTKKNFEVSTTRLNEIISVTNKKQKRNLGSSDFNGLPGYNLKLLLSQPYNYLPHDIFKNYVSNKNFVTDVPDQIWEKMCLQNNNSTEELCLGPSSIIKSEYLSGTKNGYIEYFPKSMSSYVSHINIMRGGKFFGNTIVDRSSKSIKISADFERVQTAMMSENQDDAYFRHAISNFVPTGKDIFSDSKIFLKDISKNIKDSKKRLTQSDENDIHNSLENLKYRLDFIKYNKLLILPHFFDQSTIYIGTSTIFQNYGGLKFVNTHSDDSLHVFMSKAIGISEVFLPFNVDLEEGSAFIFFIMVVFYGFFIISSLYSLTSTWKFSVFFPNFMFTKYKADMLRDRTSIHKMGNIKNVDYLIAESFLKCPKRTVFLKEVLLSTFAFLFSLMIFFVFGIPAIILVSKTYQESMLSQYIIGSYQSIQTIYPENFLVLPQDPSGTFVVISILCFTSCVLMFIGIIIHYIVNIYGENVGKKFKNLKGLSVITKSFKTMIIFRSYLGFIVGNMYQRTKIFSTLPVSEQNRLDSDIRSMSPFSETGVNIIEDWDEQGELKESVFGFVYGNLMLMIFFTAAIQFSTIHFSSFILLRMWSFIGTIIQISVSFAGLLCVMFILRVLTNRFVVNRFLNEKVKRSKTEIYDKNKIVGLFILSGVLIFSVFCINSISFVFFLVPFELGTYQSDYSASFIKYLVSISLYLGILMGIHVIWIRQWRSNSHVDILLNEFLKKNK